MTVAVPTSHRTAQGAPLKNARERMAVIAAYQQVGSYRGAAAMCGTTHKTVKRIVAAALAGEQSPPRPDRRRNYDEVAVLVRVKVASTCETRSGSRSCSSTGWWRRRSCRARRFGGCGT